ncbi:helix-turn-helix domain-containing protein [Clostridium butyricum]|uniref:helix-turn-helix domain-containing protein n=1 Tax=Clostridium butyricum TaxID=1492 RepID=UPI002AB30992|nr:helix-turn-helix transcriptional regulator [Clostridium butyricum]
MDLINNRIKSIRKALKLKQNEFSKELMISQGHLSDIENGRKEVTNKIKELIILKFNVNEDWLKNGTGNMFNPTTDDKLEQLAQEYKFNSIEYKFLRSYLNLDLNKRAAVVEFLEGILDSDSSFIRNSELSSTKEESFEERKKRELDAYALELDAEEKGRILSASEKPKGA